MKAGLLLSIVKHNHYVYIRHEKFDMGYVITYNGRIFSIDKCIKDIIKESLYFDDAGDFIEYFRRNAKHHQFIEIGLDNEEE